MAPTFAPITLGRERWSSQSHLPRHRHERGYICVVLSGGFEEAGDCGRRVVRAGDVICHGPFDAHCDRFLACGAETINFYLPDWTDPPSDYGRVRDPDLILRTAERDHDACLDLLWSMLVPVEYAARDWPDELAIEIRRDPDLRLTEWAERRNLTPAGISRGFRRVFEVSPSTFRMQMRACRAWRRLVGGTAPLAEVALQSGFADQAHMTRAMAAVTGRRPLHWRRLGQMDSRPGTAPRIGCNSG